MPPQIMRRDLTSKGVAKKGEDLQASFSIDSIDARAMMKRVAATRVAHESGS